MPPPALPRRPLSEDVSGFALVQLALIALLISISSVALLYDYRKQIGCFIDDTRYFSDLDGIFVCPAPSSENRQPIGGDVSYTLAVGSPSLVVSSAQMITAAGVTDPDGDSLSIVDFTADNTSGVGTGTFNGSSVTFTALRTGIMAFRAVVTDGNGGVAQIGGTVTITGTRSYRESFASGPSSYGLSMSASGRHLAVGAPDAASLSGTPNAGGVVIYTLEDGSVLSRDPVLLSAPSPAAGDDFGHSVALDGSVLVVGAPGGNEAYVFHRIAGTWSSPHRLSIGLGLTGTSEFGRSVATDGNRILVGAPGEGTGGTAYLFSLGSDQRWSLTRSFLASDTADGLRFGQSVGLGANGLAVGAPGKSVGGFANAGAVYAFSSAYAEVQIWTHPSPSAAARFGKSLAVDDNWIIAGSNTGGADAVHAWLYSGGTWPSGATDTIAAPASHASFADSLFLAGNVLIAGSPGSFGSAGRAYRYNGTGLDWPATPSQTFAPSSDPNGYGAGVALVGSQPIISAATIGGSGALIVSP